MTISASFDTPVLGPVVHIKDSWIEDSGYLAVGHYLDLFQGGASAVLDILNAGEAYRESDNRAFVTRQAHLNFLQAIGRGAQVRTTIRLVDADDSALHLYLELFNADGWLAATSEALLVHVDLARDAMVPFEGELARDVSTMLRYHRSLPPTKHMGLRIGVGWLVS